MFPFCLLFFLFAQCGTAVGNYGILRAQNNVEENSYCINYLPSIGEISRNATSARWWPLLVLLPWDACDVPPPETPDMANKFVLVKRYPCTFAQKASIVQNEGAKGVLIATLNDTEPYNASDPTIDPSTIHIAVVIISKNVSDKITAMGDEVRIKVYGPIEERIDYSLLVIWLWAVITITTGCFWSGISHYASIGKSELQTKEKFHYPDLGIELTISQFLTWLSKRARRGTRVSATTETDTGVSEETPTSHVRYTLINVAMIGLLVLMMCTLLLLLYFFYDYLVYIVITMFSLAAWFSTFQILDCFLTRIGFSLYKFPPTRVLGSIVKITLVQILLVFGCLAFVIYWLIVRKDRYAWILQDTLGTFFCINILRTLRVPNGMLCTLLLVMLFFYDIFFVFITPLLTKTGESVMVQVATSGGQSGEQLPMLFMFPRLRWTELKDVCYTNEWSFSRLGFGDVLIPGLLLAYLHGFDMEVQSRRIYFISTTVGYGIGLLVTFVGVFLMEYPQPALLYLVPFTLIPTYTIAAIRKEAKAIWLGRPVLSPHYEPLPQTFDSQNTTTHTLLTPSQPETGQLLEPS